MTTSYEALHRSYSALQVIQIPSIKLRFGTGNRYEPSHEKMCLMSYANNKGADQPAHPRNLISAFVVRCLDSIISLDSLAEISRL